MSLLECLIAIALCTILLGPLLQASGQLVQKQIEYEKVQLLTSEAERALELIGRAIRMAGYRNVQGRNSSSNTLKDGDDMIFIQRQSGYHSSDAITIRHELSHGIDFDCIGNVLNSDRTKQGLAQQGFLLAKQAGLPKGHKANGGSLICQSLDRQGRLQNTTLMNGVNALMIEELKLPGLPVSASQKTFRIKLEMTDGALLHQEFERTFTTRNLL